MPTDAPIRIAVTGAAGHVGYSLLPRIALGLMFGPDQPVELQLIEIPQRMRALEAVVMELHDCAFPLMNSVSMTEDLGVGFRGANWVVLCGCAPRKRGMLRKDLLGVNGKVFASQGKAIMAHAASDIRTLVVGNPCNTNCLIAMSNAKDVPADRWFAMTRLDENRAKAQLALKAGVHSTDVTNLAIWGNHSITAFPDFLNAKIGGRPAIDVIADRAWLEGDFLTTVQQRGAAMIKARGLSAAQSAAHAAVQTIHSIVNPTLAGDWHSVALSSDGSYGIEKGIICSFPTRSDGSKVEIVQGLTISDFARAKIDVTIKELVDERAMVQDQIPV
ncbi:MAG: malate dehydrogenase [Ilumatobacteraceae bacterium]